MFAGCPAQWHPEAGVWIWGGIEFEVEIQFEVAQSLVPVPECFLVAVELPVVAAFVADV